MYFKLLELFQSLGALLERWVEQKLWEFLILVTSKEYNLMLAIILSFNDTNLL